MEHHPGIGGLGSSPDAGQDSRLRGDIWSVATGDTDDRTGAGWAEGGDGKGRAVATGDRGERPADGWADGGEIYG